MFHVSYSDSCVALAGVSGNHFCQPNHLPDEYKYVTFTAITTNAGKNPKYQKMEVLRFVVE